MWSPYQHHERLRPASFSLAVYHKRTTPSKKNLAFEAASFMAEQRCGVFFSFFFSFRQWEKSLCKMMDTIDSLPLGI